jgi:hypothetical protein
VTVEKISEKIEADAVVEGYVPGMRIRRRLPRLFANHAFLPRILIKG